MQSLVGWCPDGLELSVLAVAVVIAFILGQRSRARSTEVIEQSRRDLRRAQTVARELEIIAVSIRKQLGKHQTRLDRFKQRVSELSNVEHEETWKTLCQEAEDMLRPTLHLATQIAAAYDEIRQQTNNLMTFTDVRTDPLTGVANRRALDDTLNSQFALMMRYDSSFTLAMFDIDHFKDINDTHGHLQGDKILQEVARILDESARETDTVARYGGEEFVVVMPQTDLDGAAIFADRVRTRIANSLPVTISGGVAAGIRGENAEMLLDRADKALYEAKEVGRNCVFRNDGQQSQLVIPEKTTEEVLTQVS